MTGKFGSRALLGLGVLLIIAGFVVKFMVTPALAKFPDDVDTNRTYAGTVDILNRAELESPTGTQDLFFTDLPVISEREVTTIEVDGDKALVRDAAKLLANAPGTPIDGIRLTGYEDFHTIDRVTMEAIPNFTDNNLVFDREGLSLGFPIGTEARSYTGWNGDPAQTVTLQYAGEEEREGRTTRKFTAAAGPQPIVDPGTLAEFPETFPRDAIPTIAPLLNLPEDLLGALPALLPLLPEDLPLDYTYEFEAEYWVDPATGVLIDVVKNDVRKAVISVPGVPLEIDPVTVYNLNYTSTAETLAEAVDDAESYGTQLTLGRTIVPIGLWVVGALLAGIGLAYLRRSPALRAPKAGVPDDS